MDDIKITSVRFMRKEPKDNEKVLAYASVELNDLFTINDLVMVKYENDKIKVYMPGRSREMKGGKMRYNTIFFKEFKVVLMIQNEVIKQYEYLRSIGKWKEDGDGASKDDLPQVQ